MKKHIASIIVIIASLIASVAWGASPAFENFKAGMFSRSGNTIQIAAGATNANGELLLTPNSLTGKGNLITNLHFETSSTWNDESSSNAPVFQSMLVDRVPPQLNYRPASMDGAAENNIQSATVTKHGVAPRGYATWNMFGTNMNEASIIGLIQNQTTNGSMRTGYSWQLWDEGLGYPSTVNSGVAVQPFTVAYDANRLWKIDATRFPNGFKYLLDRAHTNGIKVMLYVTPTAWGPAGWWTPLGSNRVDMANNVSNLVYLGVDGFKYEGGQDGRAHEFINEVNKWGKPIWVNMPTQTNYVTGLSYEPWMADTINSYRPGVKNYGDLNGTADRLYGWADKANFSIIRPGHVVNFDMLGASTETAYPAYWGIDNPYIRRGTVTKYTGNLNILAMMAMANSEIWLARQTAHEGEAWRYNSYYTDYNNPLVNEIQADFTKPMFVLYSNYLAVAYGKWLSDGGIAVLIQNRSTTNKTETVSLDSLFGNHHPTMVQSTNANVCTLIDISRNVTLGYATNNYSVTISPTNISWLKIRKGIVERYNPGTNYLSDHGWAYSTNYPDANPGISVNSYALPYGNGKLTINSTTYDKGFFAPSAYGEFKYMLHKQADFFSAIVQPIHASSPNSQVIILTNDVVAHVATVASGVVTNIFVGVTNADSLTIIVSNNPIATATAAFQICDPLIYCRFANRSDATGKPNFQIDPNATRVPVHPGWAQLAHPSPIDQTNIVVDMASPMQDITITTVSNVVYLTNVLAGTFENTAILRSRGLESYFTWPANLHRASADGSASLPGTLAPGQMMLLRFISAGGGVSNRIVEASIVTDATFTYDADAQSFFSRAGGLPGAQQSNAVNNLVLRLKGTNLWAKLDAAYPFADNDATGNAANLKSSSFTGSFTGSPTHTDGFVADGVDDYMTTAFIPSSAGGVYTLDSAHLSVYLESASVNDGNHPIGVYDSAGGIKRAGLRRNTTALGVDGLNMNAINAGTGFSGNYDGYWCATRSSSAGGISQVRTTQAAYTGTSLALPSKAIFIGAWNNDGTAGTFTAAHFRFATIGADLTSTEMNALKWCIEQYITEMP